MRRELPIALLVLLLLRLPALGQWSTVPATKAIAEFPGPPQNPPIFSEMTAIWQGSLQYQEADDLKGPVAAVVREEIRSSSQSPNAYHTKISMKFNDDGHLITRVDEDPLGVSTMTNVWEHGRLKSQTVVNHPTDSKFPDTTDWRRWSYDTHGRLSEFHGGRGNEEMNDFVNFKYDEKGRLLGYEQYAESLTEIRYDGNKVTLSEVQKAGRIKSFEQVQIVDEKKRVRDLRVFDLTSGQLELWYHVTFKYDDKGRVIEQDTDPFKLGDGDDYSPVPGRLVVTYDDQTHSGEQRFFDTDGRLILHTRFEYDRDGVLTKLRVLDPSGQEQMGSELFVDPVSHKASARPGNVEWEVIYDDHGNWTERRRWFTPADGRPRIMVLVIRQQITYR